MQHTLRRWIIIVTINLLLVAVLGVLLRYKIAFALPWLDQKNLLHAHSHFAFNGWVSAALMCLMVAAMSEQKKMSLFRRYRHVLFINVLAAYGMLIFFSITGYSMVSIGFSVLGVAAAWYFAWLTMQDAGSGAVSSLWFKAAVCWNILASIGGLALSYIMATKNLNQHLYLAATYFYLHFQYNGWFLFGCIGLMMHFLPGAGKYKNYRKAFVYFAIACIPAYLLSVLWMKLPGWLYLFIIAAVILQWVGWFLLVKPFLSPEKYKLRALPPVLIRWLLLLVAIAFCIKLLLQTGSVIPSLSKLAFGFRPIVIGYLHLVLLGVITLSLITLLCLQFNTAEICKLKKGAWVFVAGVVLNELALMIQGTAAIKYISVPGINIILFIIGLVLLLGIFLFIRALWGVMGGRKTSYVVVDGEEGD